MKLTCKASLYTLVKKTSHIKARIRFSELLKIPKGAIRNHRTKNKEDSTQKENMQIMVHIHYTEHLRFIKNIIHCLKITHFVLNSDEKHQ